VGIDIDTRFVAVTQVFRNKLASMVVTLDNGPSVFNSITPPGGGGPWNNKVDGNQVAASDPPDWEKAKAVRVPVDPGPTYNASLGITPRAQGTTPSLAVKILFDVRHSKLHAAHCRSEPSVVFNV
jgi:hypothetical protein